MLDDTNENCVRCRRQGLACSFNRRDCTGSSDSCQAPFLLTYTGTVGDTTAEPFIDDAMNTAALQDSTTSPGSWTTLASINPLLDDTVRYTSDPFQFWFADPTCDVPFEHNVFSDCPDSKWDLLALESCMGLVVDRLLSTHETLTKVAADSLPEFDIATANLVFTARNATAFLSSYFRYIHCYMPLSHRSTLAADGPSIPLLLALFLSGSFFSPPKDDALAARGFLRLAEELIFSNKALKNDAEIGQIGHIQSLQAALIIIVLQGEVNDPRTRRRIRQVRFPALVSAVRSLGLSRTKHENKEKDWVDFIATEVRIRYAPI